MRNDPEARALAQLLQLKQLQAAVERRQALAAAARVEEVDKQIGSIVERMAAEADTLAEPADAPALGRWADLMDGKRAALRERRAGEQRQADALAVRAAEADTAAERYRELLKERQRRLAERERRALERAEWEALAVLFAPSRR